MPEFACMDCPASFNTMRALEEHETRHAGDNPPRESRPTGVHRGRI